MAGVVASKTNAPLPARAQLPTKALKSGRRNGEEAREECAKLRVF